MMKTYFPCLLAVCLLTGCTLHRTSSVEMDETARTTLEAIAQAEALRQQVKQTAALSSQHPIALDAQEQALVPPETAATPTALAGKIICLDPGHCVTSVRRQERISPLSDQTKSAFVGGTSGNGMTEQALNLMVGLKLRDRLQAEGATVIMTRTESEVTLDNIERAQIANDAGADVCIHIHADGSDNRSVHGVSVLVPNGDLLYTPDIVQPSAHLGALLLREVCTATGAHNRGISHRSDLTGFNWSTVPTVFIEMGFMTNPEEDALLQSSDYQDKLVQGMTQGLLAYFV